MEHPARLPQQLFNGDIAQRVLVIWILVLALLFGNNTAYFLELRGMTGLVIGLFLIAKLTFVIVEMVYTIFIPKLPQAGFSECC